MHRILHYFLFFLVPFKLYSQVMINEFSSSNLTCLTDEDGQYADWMELYNNSPSIINLDGYHISDDKSLLKKWTFPAVLLKAYSYMLMYLVRIERHCQSVIKQSYQKVLAGISLCPHQKMEMHGKIWDLMHQYGILE
jgi:hypothetical protein